MRNYKKGVKNASIVAVCALFALFGVQHILNHRIVCVRDLARLNGFRQDGLIYVLEKSCYVPYFIVDPDYDGGTLLLRRDLLDTPMRFSDYSAYYEDSEIDRYLNSTYLESLAGIASLIRETNVEITDNASLGISGNNTTRIVRNAFLLSCTEIGVDDSVNCGREGTPLRFFQNGAHRFAFSGNTAMSWWLRSPSTYYLSCPYSVGPDGRIGSGNAYDLNGIRPAFCVESSAKVTLRRDILNDRAVYVFSDEQTPA